MPGEFRKSQNWIGQAGCTLASASYVPPPPSVLMTCLGELEKFMHDRSLPPLIQIAFLHYQFEATRRDCYDLLSGVSQKGEWTPGLAYFLNGIARQSEDALSRAERINQKLGRWRKDAAWASSRAPLLLIDMLAANPYLTVNKAAKHLGVAFTTAQCAIDRLEKLLIIAKVNSAKRDRVYCARSILSILEESATLTPKWSAFLKLIHRHQIHPE